MTDEKTTDREPITIKKYANRRLYNTATSSYVTLDNLSMMVRAGSEFVVYDAKTGDDITRSVLTQIIVEEEQKGGQNLLPISFLRQLIGYYGGNMQWLVPSYLEYMMKALTRNQDQFRENAGAGLGQFFPFGTTLEEMGKQNMAMLERTMKMFSPFPETGSPAAAPAPAPKEADSSESLHTLTERLNALQSQLETLTRGAKG